MKVVIIGTGSMARLVVESMEHERNFKIAGLIDDELSDYSLKGYSVLGKKSDLPILQREGNIHHAIVAVGNSELREKIFYQLDEYGFKMITSIHPSAVIASDVDIGPGTIIGPGVVIGTDVTIGSNTIIETGSIIGINSSLSDNVSIESGVTIGGGVTLSRNVTVRTGAIVSGLLTIGRHNTIEIGEVIKSSMEDKPVSL